MQKSVGARKIPLLSALTLAFGLNAGQPDAAVGQRADTAALLRAAHRAETEYESGVRRFAPVSFSSPRSGSCDEIVGRFCVYYESGGDTLPPEPAAVTTARVKAIEALQKAHVAMPAAPSIAFPLIRFLVKANRGAEAVTAARRFAEAGKDSASAHMLRGFALHGAGEPSAATDEFALWLQTLPTRRRERITDIGWLLDRQERARYERLSAEARGNYEQRVWRLADPLYLAPGNEAWADHLARYALAHMLEKRRSMPNVESWGEDVEQLTVRFGPAALTTRSWRGGGIGSQEQYSEHWDPSLRTYVAPDLAKALETEAPLDTIWPLDSLTARSGHAPPTIRTMHVLEHQASVFGNLFTVFGVARGDSLRPAALRGAVFLLDSAFNVVAQTEAVPILHGDSVVLGANVQLTSSAAFYSAEIYEPERRFGARARFRIVRPTAASELAVSSIMLAQPFAAGELPADRASSLLKPLFRPAITSGSRLGLYAEVSGAGARRLIEVQLETSRVDRPGVIGRAVGWIGAKVGLSTPRAPMRLGWSVELDPEKTNAIPVTLDLGTAEAGRYRLTLTLRDPATGGAAVATRDLLIVKTRN